MVHPIRITAQIWEVTRNQYGISTLVPQALFRWKISGGVAKCQLLFKPRKRTHLKICAKF